jgi:hypothetical protein
MVFVATPSLSLGHLLLPKKKGRGPLGYLPKIALLMREVLVSIP